LDDIYPIVSLDAILIKVRHNGQIIMKAVCLAIAATMEGIKVVGPPRLREPNSGFPSRLIIPEVR
jgi:transposase-like protein